ncbi:TlpA disulfide reductase family protein [Sinomicrobium oceani]|nr:TlpA disulfide reductase family protein [Sinomicrobium oceani]
MYNIMNTIYGVCLLLLVVSCTSKTPGSKENFELKGKISGVDHGMTVKLVPGATHSDEKPVAVTTLENGSFTFTGKLEEPRMFYVVFGEYRGMIPVMLENSEVNLSATAETINTETGRISFSGQKITGSETHEYYQEQTAFRKELDRDYAAYHEGTEQLAKLYGKARNEGNRAQMDSIEATAEWKEFESRENAFFDKVKAKNSQLISAHKDSWWGPFFMMTQYSYLTPDQRPVFEQFSDEARNSYYGQLVHEELFPKAVIGKQVAGFRLQDREGQPVETKSVFSGKKYILIDFWASWCAPCRKEIPNLKKAYEDFAPEGFEILSVSIDKKQEAWLKALQEEDMQWPNLIDDGTMSGEFKVRAIPATFLVDEKGTIIAENLRGEALDEKLKELLH